MVTEEEGRALTVSSSFIPPWTGVGPARICLLAAAAAAVAAMVAGRTAAAGVELAADVWRGRWSWTSSARREKTMWLRRRSDSARGGVQMAGVWRAADRTLSNLMGYLVL